MLSVELLSPPRDGKEMGPLSLYLLPPSAQVKKCCGIQNAGKTLGCSQRYIYDPVCRHVCGCNRRKKQQQWNGVHFLQTDPFYILLHLLIWVWIWCIFCVGLENMATSKCHFFKRLICVSDGRNFGNVGPIFDWTNLPKWMTLVIIVVTYCMSSLHAMTQGSLTDTVSSPASFLWLKNKTLLHYCVYGDVL